MWLCNSFDYLLLIAAHAYCLGAAADVRVVAHRIESAPERSQHTVVMGLISTIEVSLAQLKLELNLVLESTKRSAIGGTTCADAPSPPPTIPDTLTNYSGIGTKTIPERNTLQLRCESAKQQQRHEGCAGYQSRGGRRIEILH